MNVTARHAVLHDVDTPVALYQTNGAHSWVLDTERFRQVEMSDRVAEETHHHFCNLATCRLRIGRAAQRALHVSLHTGLTSFQFSQDDLP